MSAMLWTLVLCCVKAVAACMLTDTADVVSHRVGNWQMDLNVVKHFVDPAVPVKQTVRPARWHKKQIQLCTTHHRFGSTSHGYSGINIKVKIIRKSTQMASIATFALSLIFSFASVYSAPKRAVSKPGVWPSRAFSFSASLTSLQAVKRVQACIVGSARSAAVQGQPKHWIKMLQPFPH